MTCNVVTCNLLKFILATLLRLLNELRLINLNTLFWSRLCGKWFLGNDSIEVSPEWILTHGSGSSLGSQTFSWLFSQLFPSFEQAWTCLFFISGVLRIERWKRPLCLITFLIIFHTSAVPATSSSNRSSLSVLPSHQDHQLWFVYGEISSLRLYGTFRTLEKHPESYICVQHF